MWNQNTNFLPNNPPFRRDDQFSHHVGPSLGSMTPQKLTDRNTQPWLNAPSEFSNPHPMDQMPSRFMNSPLRHRFPSNTNRFNVPQQRFNIRNNSEIGNNEDMWSDPSPFQNLKQNFGSFPLNDRQQNDNFNRFHPPVQNADISDMQQMNITQLPSTKNRFNSPLPNKEKRNRKHVELSDVNEIPLASDRFTVPQRRWENKSNQFIDQKISSYKDIKGPNNFQARQPIFQNRFPLNATAPSNFDQSPGAIDHYRWMKNQQNMSNRLPAETRIPTGANRNTADEFQQQNLNYQFSPNAPISPNINQNLPNRFPLQQNNSQFGLEIDQPMNTNQNCPDLNCFDVPQESFRQQNSNTQFSDSFAIQQQNCIQQSYSERVPITSINDNFSQFCPQDQNFSQQIIGNSQEETMFGRTPPTSTFSQSYGDQLFMDSLPPHSHDGTATQRVDTFSPHVKMENAPPPIHPEPSFNAMQKDSMQDVMGQSQNNITTGFPLPQQTFGDQLFDSSQLDTNITKTTHEKASLFAPELKFSNHLPAADPKTSLPLDSLQQNFSENSVYTSQAMTLAQERLCTSTSTTFSFAHHGFDNQLFHNNQSFHENDKNVPSGVHLYPPEVSFNNQFGVGQTKLPESQQFNSTQHMNESGTRISGSTSVTYSSPHQQTHCIQQSMEPQFHRGIVENRLHLQPKSTEPPMSSLSNQLNDQVCNPKFSPNDTNMVTFGPHNFNHPSVLGSQQLDRGESSLLASTLLAPTSQNATSVSNVIPHCSSTRESTPVKLNQPVMPSDTPKFELNIADRKDANSMKTQLFVDPSGNHSPMKVQQPSIPNEPSLPDPLCPEQPSFDDTLGLENQASKDKLASIIESLKTEFDEKETKNVDENVTKMPDLNTTPKKEILNPTSISDTITEASSNMCHSSFDDAELKYSAIPFFGTDDDKSEPLVKTLMETSYSSDLLDLMKPEKVSPSKDTDTSGQDLATTPKIKDNNAINAAEDLKPRSPSQEPLAESSEKPKDEPVSAIPETVVGKSTSTELPAFDISQVLSDPKMLNDILHAAKAIQLSDYSQTVTFPSSTSSSSKSIAIVPPMQSDVPNISFSSNSDHTSSRYLESKKFLPSHSPIMFKSKTEAAICSSRNISEVGSTMTQAITSSCNAITSGANEALLNSSISTDQSVDGKHFEAFSTSFCDSTLLRQLCDDLKTSQDQVKNKEAILKRTCSELAESKSLEPDMKVRKKDPNNEFSENIPADVNRLEDKSSAIDQSKSKDSSELSQLVSDDSCENEQLSALFSTLSKCPINSDGDANLVLKVISLLTELFLKYKLRELPDERRTMLIESVQTGDPMQTENVLKILSGCPDGNESTTLDTATSLPEENSAAVEPSVASSTEKIETTPSQVQDAATSRSMDIDEMCVPSSVPFEAGIVNSFSNANILPLPQPLSAMYSSCPVNMPMSYWMNSGAPLMSIPPMPEPMTLNQTVSQYPPLPPPPMMSMGSPFLPPPPPPQFTMAKPPVGNCSYDLSHGHQLSMRMMPPLPPQYPVDRPPLPPPPLPPCE